jgi:hypothetical protein
MVMQALSKPGDMRTIWMLLTLLMSLTVKAQDDAARAFGIDGQIGGAASPHVRTTTNGAYAIPEKVGSGYGMLSKLRVEYYLPNTPLSLKAGYEHEEWNFLDTNLGDDMAIFSLGGRCYPGRKSWFVQPYIGLDALYNFNGGSRVFSRELNNNRYGRVRYDGMAHIPRFSLAPIAGVDLYLFSCIAIQLEYSCRMGFSKASVIQAKYNHLSEPFEIRLRPIRHGFNIGLKVTFPFHFTEKDGQKVVDGLLDDLLYNILFGPNTNSK